MRSRLLYFPYIRIPESAWLTQALLYWDKLSSIVPLDFVDMPEALGEFMQRLVQEELVCQVFPGAYIYGIPGFFEKFASYVDGLDDRELKVRQKNFARGKTFKIHIEKMDEIAQYLKKRKLAFHYQGPWHKVERETAQDFMSYLACSLGRVPRVDSVPLTDESRYLRRLKIAGVSTGSMTQQLQSVRIQVLNRILPIPSEPIQPVKIRLFKEKHGAKLARFRIRVERELVEASAINDTALRKRHLEIFLDEANESIQELQEVIQSEGWKTARAACSVLTAIPGISPIVGLAGKLWNALGDKHSNKAVYDFAYAAYAQKELR